MIELTPIYIILVLHFLGDFYLQSNKIAENKYKCGKELFTHGIIYFFVFVLINPLYALINAIIHIIIDGITSNISKIMYEQGKIHEFFLVLGLDQLLHTLTLLITFSKFFT